MIDLRNISKSFGDKIVLDGINLTVASHDKIALIGPNGAGKTTLIRLILGELSPDNGRVVSDSNVNFGYVAQKLETNDTIEKFFDDTPTWRMLQSFSRVGLSDCDLSKQITSLSGGHKTRLCFAKVLARDSSPNMLILDEPTNNLDSAGLDWLSGFLKSFRGGVIFSSHDRAFINLVAEKVVELRDGKICLYGGNYDFYRVQKDALLKLQQEKYEEYIEQRKNLRARLGIERQRAERRTSTRKVKDHDKYIAYSNIENMQQHASDQMHALKSKLRQLDEVDCPMQPKKYKTSLGGTSHSGKLILRLSDIYKSYEHELFSGLSLEIFGEHRIQIAGPNGAGKSTLLKIIAGRLQPDSGTVKLGVEIRIGYMSQELEDLVLSQTGFENLVRDYDKQNIMKQAKIIGLMPHDLSQLVGNLSHGQKVKVNILKLLLGDNELLILDEPTNHLDIETRELIENALGNYHGALLVASHDKYFVDKLGAEDTVELG